MKFLSLAALLGLASAGPAPKISVDTENRVLTDEHGRQVLFHGVNVVPKVPPYLPLTEDFDPQKSLTQED
jgi:endoglycosylceramidase